MLPQGQARGPGASPIRNLVSFASTGRSATPDPRVPNPTTCHRRAWREGAPSPIRNLVFFASTAALRVRRPVKEDELQDGGRSTALKRYFDPVDLENAPPGIRRRESGFMHSEDGAASAETGSRSNSPVFQRPQLAANPREMYLDRSKFDRRRFNRQSYSTDDGSPLNPREMDLSWLRPHFEEQSTPPLEQLVAEQEASAEALLGGGGGKLEAADVEAAAHHWRVMRLIFTGSFWSETY